MCPTASLGMQHNVPDCTAWRCYFYACSGVLWFLCLPLTHIIDVPDSLCEVMTALLLVATINYVVIYAAKLSSK